MNTNEFRKGHVPAGIINALVESIRAHAKMEVLLNEHPNSSPVLSDILLSLDIYYGLYDIQPDICQIVQSLYVPDRSTVIAETIHAISACVEYAQNKANITDVLTAGDLLRIDQAIKTTNTKLLMADEFISESEQKIKEVWSVLHDLYGPERQYPLLLEAVLAFYQLCTLQERCRPGLHTIRILLSTLYKCNLTFSGLQMQWILLTDPRSNLSSMNTDDAIVHILHVFQRMWKCSVTLIHRLDSKRNEMEQSIYDDSGKQMPKEIPRLLVENLCIKNRDVSEKMQVSPKTAIKYLKLMERRELLYSLKAGREVFYFSSVLLDLLRLMTEELGNGTKKP